MRTPSRNRRPGVTPLLGLLLLAGLACDSGVTPPVGPSAAIQVINGTTGDIRVLVDGETRIASLGAASVSGGFEVPEGTRTLTVESMNGAMVTATSSAEVVASVGGTRYVSVLAGVGGLEASVVEDTGAVAAPGATKMRVIHLAAEAPAIEALRKQPDFSHTAISFMSPFEYGAVSGYVASTPGTWEIIVRPEFQSDSIPGAIPPAALATRTFVLTAGQVKTAVVLDAGGGAVKIEPLDP